MTRRYREDLDLLYITDRIIICSAPVDKEESGNLSEFLHSKYRLDFKIVNCSDLSKLPKEYNIDSDGGEKGEYTLLNKEYFESVEAYSCIEHNMGIRQLIHFCRLCEQYLAQNPNGVMVVTCDEGKGKSAVFIASFLLHSGNCTSVEEVITMINSERTPKGHEIDKAIYRPAHVRYLSYYEALLKSSNEDLYHTKTLRLCRVRFPNCTPDYSRSLLNSGCNINIRVKVIAFEQMKTSKGVKRGEELETHTQQLGTESAQHKVVFDELSEVYSNDYSTVPFRSAHESVDLDLFDHNILLRQDCILEVLCDQEIVMSVSFHTAFVEAQFLQFDKNSIDIIAQDTHHHIVGPDFKMECVFQKIPDDHNINVIGIEGE